MFDKMAVVDFNLGETDSLELIIAMNRSKQREVYCYGNSM
jgi:hypothetical protein